MNELKIFENSEFGSIRVIEMDNDTWFVGKDIAEVLGYANTKDALASHVEKEDKRVIQRSEIATFENHIPKEVLPVNFVSGDIPNRGLTIINESGLYALIFGSKLKTAKDFKHWITSEVLPTIRKYGIFAKEELLDNPDLLISVAQALKSEREKNKSLQEDNERMRPKEIFADAVMSSHTSILVGDLAKMIMQNGTEIGQKRMFTWLRDNGYLIKRKGSDWNMPTQRSMEMGLFEVKESTTYNPDGSLRINRTTKVTGKGQQYFINKFLQPDKLSSCKYEER